MQQGVDDVDCPRHVLYVVDQNFIQNATILYENRETPSMPNLIREVTGYDPESLVYNGYMFRFHLIDLTILPDTNAARTRCYEQTVSAEGIHGKCLRELAKRYRPRDMELEMTINSSFEDDALIYDYYGESSICINLEVDMAIDLGRLMLGRTNYFSYKFKSNFPLRISVLSLINLVEGCMGPITFLHNEYHALGTPTPWAKTLEGPDSEMLSGVQRLVSSVMARASSNYSPVRLLLQVTLTDQERTQLRTFCTELSPTATSSGNVTTLTVGVAGEMPFRSSTQSISVEARPHTIHIKVARNRDTRSNQNPVRRRITGKRMGG